MFVDLISPIFNENICKHILFWKTLSYKYLLILELEEYVSETAAINESRG